MYCLPLTYAFCCLWATATANPISSRNADALLKTVYQFPNLTWVENIAVRSNGKILVSLINVPQIWQIDPNLHSVELVYEFPAAVSAMGLAEYAPDVFGVNVGNFSDITAQATPGSWSTWSISFTDDHHGSWEHSNKADAVVSKIVDIPSAIFLNGLTAVPAAPGILLSADSGAGLIYRIDTKTDTWSVFLDDPALKANASAAVAIGVNGIHARKGYLYFDNSFQAPLLARVPYTPDTKAAGPVEILFESASYPLNAGNGQADDFSFDKTGNTWLATASSSLVKLSPATGEQKLIAGGPNNPTIVGTTATAFGRTRNDKDILYITTNGGISDLSVAGIVGGKVVALDTRGL